MQNQDRTQKPLKQMNLTCEGKVCCVKVILDGVKDAELVQS